MATQKVATKPELEEAIVDIWETAQNADGSRAGLLEALDQIQDRCAEVVPNVEGQAADFESDDEDSDGEGDEDSDDD